MLNGMECWMVWSTLQYLLIFWLKRESWHIESCFRSYGQQNFRLSKIGPTGYRVNIAVSKESGALDNYLANPQFSAQNSWPYASAGFFPEFLAGVNRNTLVVTVRPNLDSVAKTGILCQWWCYFWWIFFSRILFLDGLFCEFMILYLRFLHVFNDLRGVVLLYVRKKSDSCCNFVL